MGVPPSSVGSEKGGPHQPGAVGVSLHGPTHIFPPPAASTGSCAKKAMGCAGIMRFHQDNEAVPG